MTIAGRSLHAEASVVADALAPRLPVQQDGD